MSKKKTGSKRRPAGLPWILPATLACAAIAVWPAGCGWYSVAPAMNANGALAIDRRPPGRRHAAARRHPDHRRSVPDRHGGPTALATAAAPGEELWVIARPDTPVANETAARVRRRARLRRHGLHAPRRRPETGAEAASTLVPMPLRHTSVNASVDGYIAPVAVTQQFHNPFAEKIEAVYVFPLPQNAAVNEFVMTIGDRRIRGIIRERQEAEQIYREARSQGYVASLLTQERPNIFTQKVANIEPGQADRRRHHATSTRSRYDDGWYEFVFPMVVGPRFNPPGTHQRHRRRGARPRRTSPAATESSTSAPTNARPRHRSRSRPSTPA